MSQRWEYKEIIWTLSIENREALLRSWRSEFRISDPGKEPETRLASTTDSNKARVEKAKLIDLLAEFGADDWELVSETVLDSAVMTESQGWSNVGSPVRIRWVMKRSAQPQVGHG